MVAQVIVPVSNVSALLEVGFTHIEIWASTNQSGSWEEITAPTATAGVVETLMPGKFRLGGSQLVLSVNGADPVAVTFPSMVTLWSSAQVVSKLNEAIPGIASVVDGNVRLTSPGTGRFNSISVISSDAAAEWLPLGTYTGKDARLPLDVNTVLYVYTDGSGYTPTRYESRFSANGANPRSEFSDWKYGLPLVAQGVPVSIGYAKFISVEGWPEKRKMIIAVDRVPMVTGGYSVGQEKVMAVESDDEGFLQVQLVRGAKIRIALEGTTMVREVVVPNAPTFDLMAALGTAPDAFTVQAPLPIIPPTNL